MGTVWDPIADGSEIVGILSSSKRNNRRPARNSYTSSQRRAPSSGGGSFFAHVKSALSWTLGLGLGAALLVGLGVGGLQLHRMATTSEFFAIKRVEIRGTTHFSREEVLKAANLQSGVNSLTVNIADVEQGLRDNPWVLSVAVKRRLPDAFEIRIRERIPAFWMLKDGVLYYADNRGQIIAPVNVPDRVDAAPFGNRKNVTRGRDRLALTLPEHERDPTSKIRIRHDQIQANAQSSAH